MPSLFCSRKYQVYYFAIFDICNIFFSFLWFVSAGTGIVGLYAARTKQVKFLLYYFCGKVCQILINIVASVLLIYFLNQYYCQNTSFNSDVESCEIWLFKVMIPLVSFITCVYIIELYFVRQSINTLRNQRFDLFEWGTEDVDEITRREKRYENSCWKSFDQQVAKIHL